MAGTPGGRSAAPAGAAHHAPPVAPRTGIGAFLAQLSRVIAILGGAMLLIAVFVTVVSVILRYTTGRPVTGDIEIVELITAIVAFSAFPLTYITRSNISAEFFTAAFPPRVNRTLDFVHDLVFTVFAAALTWRMFTGMLDKREQNAASMMLDIPEWWGFAVAVGASAVLTAICAWFVFGYLRGKR